MIVRHNYLVRTQPCASSTATSPLSRLISSSLLFSSLYLFLWLFSCGERCRLLRLFCACRDTLNSTSTCFFVSCRSFQLVWQAHLSLLDSPPTDTACFLMSTPS